MIILSCVLLTSLSCPTRALSLAEKAAIEHVDVRDRDLLCARKVAVRRYVCARPLAPRRSTLALTELRCSRDNWPWLLL